MLNHLERFCRWLTIYVESELYSVQWRNAEGKECCSILWKVSGYSLKTKIRTTLTSCFVQKVCINVALKEMAD